MDDGGAISTAYAALFIVASSSHRDSAAFGMTELTSGLDRERERLFMVRMLSTSSDTRVTKIVSGNSNNAFVDYAVKKSNCA
jgi:hypothetical protein